MTENDFEAGSTVSVMRRLPRFVKVVLVVQLGLIVYLASWMYMEYQNNKYLQAYVQTSLQTNMPVLQVVLPVFLATGTITVYTKLLTGKRESTEEYSGEEFQGEPQELQATSVPSSDDVMEHPTIREAPPQLTRIPTAHKMQRTTTRRSDKRRPALKRPFQKRESAPEDSRS